MRFRLSLAFCIVLALACQPLLADSVITMKAVRSPSPGSDAGPSEETSTVWLGQNRIREDTPDQSVIVNLDDKKIFIVKHKSKSYHALDLPIDIKKLIPEEMAPMFDSVMKQMVMDVEVTPTDETRRIGDYDTKKSLVKLKSPMGLEMDLVVWASTGTGLDVDTYKRLALEMASMQPTGTEWISKVLAIPGFPVMRETTVKMNGSEMTTREELVGIEDKEPPAGIYAPPSDYKEEPFDFMSAMPGH